MYRKKWRMYLPYHARHAGGADRAHLGLRSPALQSCEPFQTKLSPGIVASHELSDEALPDLVRGLKAIPVLFVPKFDVCELSELTPGARTGARRNTTAPR